MTSSAFQDCSEINQTYSSYTSRRFLACGCTLLGLNSQKPAGKLLEVFLLDTLSQPGEVKSEAQTASTSLAAQAERTGMLLAAR